MPMAAAAKPQGPVNAAPSAGAKALMAMAARRYSPNIPIAWMP